MNDEQHAFWLAYIRHLADLMRLKDWNISLARTGPESPTSDAQNFLHYGQRDCEISLPQKFFAQSPETQRSLIAHELIHAHMEDLSECIRLYINNNGDSEAYFPQVYLRESEVLVDTLALVIAPFLPLPGEIEPVNALSMSGFERFAKPGNRSHPVVLNGAVR